MNPEIEKLQKQIAELKNEIDSLKKSSTFPKEISSALIEILSDKDETLANLTRTGTAGNSITQTVNVSGSSFGNLTALVPANPDGYAIFNIRGRDYYIPYFRRS